MHVLLFTWLDIIKAPGLAWSIRKMNIAFRGIITAWAIYFIFTYAALMVTNTGRELGIVYLFRYFEYFPYIFPISFTLYSYSNYIKSFFR